MESKSKRRKFYYKAATFSKDLADSSISLESLLKKAMKKVNKAYERFQNPGADGVEFRFLNYSGSHSPRENAEGRGDAVFGCEFLQYEKGADQSTLAIDQNAEEIDVSSLSPNEGQEFLSGSAYFCCQGNSVIVNTSKSLRLIDLEEYLNWFLIERAKVLTDKVRLQLNDHVSAARKSQIKGVKNISFSAPVKWEQDASSKKAETKGVIKAKRIPIRMFGHAWEALNALLGKDALPRTLSVGSLTETPEIEVKILLKWIGAKGEDDQNFLDGVASNLRHVDDEVDYTVQADSGSISRDEIKLYEEYNIRWIKGRPDFTDIFPKMAEWLDILISDGKIDV